MTVICSAAFTLDDERRCMQFIADGRVRVAELHSRTVFLAELPATMAELAGGCSDVKVLVDPR